MRIFYKGKSIEIPVRTVGFFGRFIGLMFHSFKTKNLLFEFDSDGKRAIHSYFVFFKFLAIWLDEKNKMLEFRVFKPFTSVILAKQRFRKLVEVPFNNENKAILEFLVGKETFKYN